MRFEHLIEINDPANPAVIELTRAELWRGLMCRAEDPLPFVPGLDACAIVARAEGELQRELTFGQTVVRDRVTYQPLEWICFEAEAGREHAGGRLTIAIEEPRPGALFLRFLYQTTLAEGDDTDGRAVAGYVKLAYEDSDIETVRLIRRIAERARAG